MSVERIHDAPFFSLYTGSQKHELELWLDDLVFTSINEAKDKNGKPIIFLNDADRVAIGIIHCSREQFLSMARKMLLRRQESKHAAVNDLLKENIRLRKILSLHGITP